RSARVVNNRRAILYVRSLPRRDRLARVRPVTPESCPKNSRAATSSNSRRSRFSTSTNVCTPVRETEVPTDNQAPHGPVPEVLYQQGGSALLARTGRLGPIC